MSQAPVAAAADGVWWWPFVITAVVLNLNKYLVDKE